MLEQGSLVTYKAHPEWGPGVIEFASPNGRLTTSFEINGQPYADDFHALELEPARPTLTRIA